MRKAKTSKHTKRRGPTRSPYPKVLLVCEGSDTEPNYFQRLVRFYRLNTANVVVDGNCDSSPRSVFKYAVKLWSQENETGDPYDSVYCIFDKDTHETYSETIDKISHKKPKDIFFLAHSVPCFEYWLILHFRYTTSPYAAAGKYTIGGMVEQDLKKDMPTYSKDSKTIFEELQDKIETAKKNAAKALQCAQNNGTDNPSTHVHILVEYLQNLKLEGEAHGGTTERSRDSSTTQSTSQLDPQRQDHPANENL